MTWVLVISLVVNLIFGFLLLLWSRERRDLKWAIHDVNVILAERCRTLRECEQDLKTSRETNNALVRRHRLVTQELDGLRDRLPATELNALLGKVLETRAPPTRPPTLYERLLAEEELAEEAERSKPV